MDLSVSSDEGPRSARWSQLPRLRHRPIRASVNTCTRVCAWAYAHAHANPIQGTVCAPTGTETRAHVHARTHTLNLPLLRIPPPSLPLALLAAVSRALAPRAAITPERMATEDPLPLWQPGGGATLHSAPFAQSTRTHAQHARTRCGAGPAAVWACASEGAWDHVLPWTSAWARAPFGAGPRWRGECD